MDLWPVHTERERCLSYGFYNVISDYSHRALTLAAMLMLCNEWVQHPILALVLPLTLTLCVNEPLKLMSS